MLLLKLKSFLWSLRSVPNLLKAGIIHFSGNAKPSTSYQIIHYYLVEEIAWNEKNIYKYLGTILKWNN